MNQGFFLPEVWAVELPEKGWAALLEILESHTAKHGEFDITTIIELHNQIKEQTGINTVRHASKARLDQVLGL